MQKRVELMALVLTVILFSVCSREMPMAPSFSVDITADSFPSTGGQKTIHLTADVSWSASTSDDWLTISPSQGKGETSITITATVNNSPVARNGKVTLISMAGKSININISQPSNHLFNVDLRDVEFEAESQDVTVILTSNTAWQASSNVDWLSVCPATGTGTASILVSAIRNTEAVLRKAIVTLSPETGETIEINISQEPFKHIVDSIRYVAPSAIGNGSGDSKENAADFLNDSFWTQVNNKLKYTSVEVRFIPGTYSRAFTEKSLTLENLGSAIYQLTLTGSQEVRFTAPGGYPDKNQMIRIDGCQNMVVSNFHFTGNGRIGYALRVITTATSTLPNKNIVIEDCTWKDMRGVIYGATGCYGTETSHVTFKNCTFFRVGIDSHSHHMYHAHGASHITIMDSRFEDCTGDYVRFRDRCDFGIVKNCMFIRNQGYTNRPFIAVPLFNNANPGDEYFATNYSFTGNSFFNKNMQNTTNAIYFGHWGFSTKDFSCLLTEQEGIILTSGTKEAKADLLKSHFGLDMAKIRITNNAYERVVNRVALISQASYGSTSLGWAGTADIADLPNANGNPFDWEMKK